MLLWMLRKIARIFRHYLITTGNPRHIAHGIALGLVLGLVPKTTLTAVALLASIFALHVHLGAALLSACVFSLAGPWLDPLLHRVGLQVLQSPSLTEFWRRLFETPLSAWTALDNTVVVGALVVGVVLYLPAYFIGSRLSRRWMSESGQNDGDAAEAPNQAEPDVLTEMLDLADADQAELEARLASPKARAVRRLDDNGEPGTVIIEDSIRIVAAAHAESPVQESPESTIAAKDAAANSLGGEASDHDEESGLESGLESGPRFATAVEIQCALSPPIGERAAEAIEGEAGNESSALESADGDADDEASSDEPAILEMPTRSHAEIPQVVNGKHAAAGYFRGA